MSKFAYIATPYSHPERSVRMHRFAEAQYAAKRLSEEYIAYSSIAHWHPIAQDFALPTDAMFWKRQNEGVMSHCDCIIVCKFDGWDTSKGVAMEIQYAKDHNIELLYLDPKDGKVTSGD